MGESGLKKLFLLIGLTVIFGGLAMIIDQRKWSEKTWSVGKATIQGNSVVYKFINELPNEEFRNKLRWLTVVSWRYDGSNNDGMPPKEINELMVKLEDSLEKIEGRENLYLDVYTETGRNLKEFVFYISDRDEFMKNFNNALKGGHPPYPIEIAFYEDKEWTDLVRLQNDFQVTAK